MSGSNDFQFILVHRKPPMALVHGGLEISDLPYTVSYTLLPSFLPTLFLASLPTFSPFLTSIHRCSGLNRALAPPRLMIFLGKKLD